MGELTLNGGGAVPTLAPLRNVQLFSGLMERVQNRQRGLPGMACFYGPSGYGKTQAAIYAANKHRAYHVQVKSCWTRKTLCSEICLEMGLMPQKTIPDMVKQIGSELALSRRPLIVDEADYLLSRGMIELIRDIYEGSYGALILIGEEMLPHKLKPFERLHGRMIDWGQAQPGSLSDARLLGGVYCGGVQIGDDLLRALHEASAGSVRRICVNLDRVREKAQTAGVTAIDLAGFGQAFFTGNPPARRS